MTISDKAPEMLEKLARALYEDRYPENSWDGVSEMVRADYRGHARAVLDALQDPTEEMMEAGEGEGPVGCEYLSPEMARQIFRAMLNRARGSR